MSHPNSENVAPAASKGIRAFEEVVLQHSNDVALLLHPKYGVVYASPAVEHVLGLQPHHFLGLLASGWVHPDDVGIAIEQRQFAVTNGHSGPVHLRGLHGDGTFRWFEAEWWHLANDHTVLHLRNVEQQRAVAEEVTRHAARTAALLAHAEEVILEVDPETGTASALGRGLEQLLGTPVDDVPWRQLLDPASHGVFAGLLHSGGEAVVTSVGGAHYRCRIVVLQELALGRAVYLNRLPA